MISSLEGKTQDDDQEMSTRVLSNLQGLISPKDRQVFLEPMDQRRADSALNMGNMGSYLERIDSMVS